MTPELIGPDRELLSDTLRRFTDAVVGHGADEQLLHGEPHPGNVLRTQNGLLFVDLETICRGPVEFDVAHAPDEVGRAYRHADPDLLRECRVLTLALATTWRWDRNDQLPNGRQLGVQWLSQIRAAQEFRRPCPKTGVRGQAAPTRSDDTAGHHLIQDVCNLIGFAVLRTVPGIEFDWGLP